MQHRKYPVLYLLMVLALLMLLTGCGHQKSKNDVQIIRIANPQATGDNVTLGYEKFEKLVEEKSNGKIDIQLYSNAMLGSDRATTESVQGGTLDMASCSSPNFAGFIPEFMAFDLPYVTSPKYQKNLYDAIDNGELGKYYREIARTKGFEIIMFSEYGYRNFVTSSKKIENIGDFKGLKLRTTDSPVEVSVAQAVGSIAMPVAWGETYTALSQGAVDGEGNTWSLLYSAKHGEILKYGIDSQHNYSMHILLMNKKRFDELSDKNRKILLESAREALNWQRGIAQENEAKNKQHLIDGGMTIHDLTPEEREAFKNSTEKVYKQYIGSVVPEKAVALVQATQRDDYQVR